MLQYEFSESNSSDETCLSAILARIERRLLNVRIRDALTHTYFSGIVMTGVGPVAACCSSPDESDASLESSADSGSEREILKERQARLQSSLMRYSANI